MKVKLRLILLFLLAPWVISLAIPVALLFLVGPRIDEHTGKDVLALHSLFTTVLTCCTLWLYGHFLLKKQALSLDYSDHVSELKTRTVARPRVVVAFRLALVSVGFPVFFALFQLAFRRFSVEESPWLLQWLLVALIVAPLVEEFFFRALLFAYCRKNNLAGFVLWSSLFFALNHGYTLSLDAAILFLCRFVFALVCLALPYARRRSFVEVVVNHVLWNLAVGILDLWVPRAGLQPAGSGVAAVLVLVVLGALIFSLYRPERGVRRRAGVVIEDSAKPSA